MGVGHQFLKHLLLASAFLKGQFIISFSVLCLKTSLLLAE